jgi:hypothetical protein
MSPDGRQGSRVRGEAIAAGAYSAEVKATKAGSRSHNN